MGNYSTKTEEEPENSSPTPADTKKGFDFNEPTDNVENETNILSENVRKREEEVVENEIMEDPTRSAIIHNPLIMSTIFSHIPNVSALRNSRLVSTWWRNLSLDQWRSTATLRVAQGMNSCKRTLSLNKLTTFVTDPAIANETDLSLPGLLEKPFQRHKILGKLYIPRTFQDESLSYWEIFGPHIRSLNLSDSVYFDSGHETEGLRLLFKYCPNMKEMILSPYVRGGTRNFKENAISTKVKDDEMKIVSESFQSLTLISNSIHEEPVTELFYENVPLCRILLQMVPKLKTLIIQTSPDSFLEALQYPVTDNFVQLKHLEISKLNQHSLQLLTEYLEVVANPSLKSLKLKIHIDIARTPLWNLRKVMELMQDQIQSLTLEIIVHYSNLNPSGFNDLNGYSYSELTELNLKFDFSYYRKNSFIQFDFRVLRVMPKLKKLRCNFSGYETSTWIAEKLDKQHLNGHWAWALTASGSDKELERALLLEQLEELYFFRSFSSAALKVLSKWMPKLRVLETVLDKETFPLVLSLWPGLEKVKLLPFSNVPEVLIASNREKYQRVKIEHTKPQFFV